MEEKKIGSTEGHASAHSSPSYPERVEVIRSRRQQECIRAIREKDFEALQRVTEEDCLDMHHVMQTQNPPLHYLNAETHRIVDAIKALRAKEHIPVLFTMDAGPTVHLVCPEEGRSAVLSFISRRDAVIFEARGLGAIDRIDFQTTNKTQTAKRLRSAATGEGRSCPAEEREVPTHRLRSLGGAERRHRAVRRRVGGGAFLFASFSCRADKRKKEKPASIRYNQVHGPPHAPRRPESRRAL